LKTVGHPSENPLVLPVTFSQLFSRVTSIINCNTRLRQRNGGQGILREMVQFLRGPPMLALRGSSRASFPRQSSASTGCSRTWKHPLGDSPWLAGKEFSLAHIGYAPCITRWIICSYSFSGTSDRISPLGTTGYERGGAIPERRRKSEAAA